MIETTYDLAEEGPPEVHPDQTSIPEPTNRPGELGLCYWCAKPAVFGRIDIGLPKRAHQPRTLVQACHAHFRDTVAPALAEQAAEKERKRIAAHQAKRGR